MREKYKVMVEVYGAGERCLMQTDELISAWNFYDRFKWHNCKITERGHELCRKGTHRNIQKYWIAKIYNLLRLIRACGKRYEMYFFCAEIKSTLKGLKNEKVQDYFLRKIEDSKWTGQFASYSSGHECKSRPSNIKK